MQDFVVFHVNIVAGATMAISAIRGVHPATSCIGILLCTILAYSSRPEWLRRSEALPETDPDDTDDSE